ncbi:MAG: septum formation protein Maf [Clostridia bacterium]|nr:septum formation protein Maf [Clostridia bacterium]
MKLILASQSPRRKEILENLGLSFEIVVANADESSPLTDPCALVELLSHRKAAAVRERLLSEGRDLSDTVILASDTVVAVDGQILGKPRDAADAKRMLGLLSGRAHQVVSGVCLMSLDREGVSHEVTEVVFDPLEEDTVNAYIEKAQPYDKAGAYAIQGLASAYIRGIRGDYFNVVGLPVHETCALYRKIFHENLL